MQPNDQDLDACAFRNPESGQASVLLLFMLSTFLLGAMAFAVDLTSMWFHRQAIQSAADATCLAGASDMLAVQAGVTPPGTGFTPGTNGNCADTPSAPLCQYANFNGYNGGGLKNVDGSNSVTWLFPPTVNGVATPKDNFPFLKVAITENVRTFFTGFLHASQYQPVSASSTCGVSHIKEAPPVVVLNRSAPAFIVTGGSTGGNLNVIGGPSRSLQVNSSSTSAIQLTGSSASINLSAGGPDHTGSDVAIYGGPSTPTGVGASNPFDGGTTGHWTGHNLPIADPFGSLSAPTSVKGQTPLNGNIGRFVNYKIDNCPDSAHGCVEFSPGYYPGGISITGTIINGHIYSTSTLIFTPGIYYMGQSLSITGAGITLRMAKPATGYRQTDGIMFYFANGTLGMTGGGTSAGIDPALATDLTCDGSAPSAALNMPATISGNVLWGQCTNDGTYWDAGNDTTDSQGNPGSRGMLIYQDRSNTAQANLTGSNGLGFSGTIYTPSSTLNLTGSNTAGAYILGDIVADKIQITGSGSINLALNPAKTVQMAKVALLQ